MKKYIGNFKIAGILNLILGFLTVSVSSFYGIVLIVTGIILFCMNCLELKDIAKVKGFILAGAIIMIFFNLISSVFIFIGYDNLTTELKEKDELKLKKKSMIDQEVKKIDLLLKLGVLMVVISSVLFATASWDVISSSVKTILLFCLGILFFLLSIFSDKKLKIKKTTVTYWILGITFLLSTWVGICYFEVFGKLFTYSGELKDLAYFITDLLAMLFIYLTSKKFQISALEIPVNILLYLGIYYFMNYIGLAPIINILAIELVSILNLIAFRKEKNSSLYQVSKLLNLILFVFISKYINNSYIGPITCLINAITLLLLAIKNKDSFENIIIPIIIYYLILLGVDNLNIDSYELLCGFGIISLFSVISRLCPLDKKFKNTTSIIYHLCSFVICIAAYSETSLELIIISGLYFLVNLINMILKRKEVSRGLDYYVSPIIFIQLISAICYYINDNFISIPLIIGFGIVNLSLIIPYSIVKKPLKTEYSIILLILLGYGVSLFSDNNIYIILNIISCMYLFIRNIIKKEKIWSYVYYLLILVSAYNILVTNNIFNLDFVISNLIVIAIYFIFLVIFKIKKELMFSLITHGGMLISLYEIANEAVTLDYSIQLIVNNILQFYVLYLIIKLLCKTKNLKNTVLVIGSIFIILDIIFEGGIYIGLYVGLIGLILIIVGYLEKNTKAIFNTGIVITIVNIVYQLEDLWGSLPFWLYLLIVGLLLIFFVTYKEVKKSK